MSVSISCSYCDDFLIADRWPSCCFLFSGAQHCSLAYCMAHQIFRTLHLYKVCVLGRLSSSSLQVGSSRQFCHYNARCSSEITGRREVGGMACRDQRLYCCICSIRSLFSFLLHIQCTPKLRCCWT